MSRLHRGSCETLPPGSLPCFQFRQFFTRFSFFCPCFLKTSFLSMQWFLSGEGKERSVPHIFNKTFELRPGWRQHLGLQPSFFQLGQPQSEQNEACFESTLRLYRGWSRPETPPVHVHLQVLQVSNCTSSTLFNEDERTKCVWEQGMPVSLKTQCFLLMLLKLMHGM